MENLTVSSVIKLLPENNEQVLKFTNELENYLDSGDVNPLDILLCIRGFEKVVKNVKELLNQLAVDECSKYSEKDIKYNGATLNVVETGVKYHYNGCNDFMLEGFEKTETELKEKLKKRQTFLKTLDIDNGMELINEETGELVRVFPPVKVSTTTTTVSLG